MCKEDVRIKRKTDFRTSVKQCVNAAIVQIFPANPQRVALSIGWTTAVTDTLNGLATLRSGGGANDPVIIGLSPSQGSQYATVEQLGQLLTREVWFYGNEAGATPVTITEVFFTQELADL